MNLKENKISKKTRNRTLRDIKMEVGEDTSAILDVLKRSSRRHKRSLPKETRQTFLGGPNEEPYNVDISESEIINVKKRPDTETLIEVKDFAELKKVEKTFKFINRYENEKDVIYFVGNYFYRIHKT
ncbi:MAG: hypothetical protein B6U86_02950 [Candidatus Altiarchaeales archaeon ex4484_43]|nr:MAG: hypothetical protein B6U86_02950 [Candidatus Altiarchaeales archaeon ex4484_43]RLI89141.1 MAG: hypothetical protein DRO62_02245 [Candidatus Altiarchaeales archaeon]